MTTKHTPTSWGYQPNDERLCKPGTEHLFSVVRSYRRGQDTITETIAENIEQDDARHIVACVNACDGLSTEALERNEFVLALQALHTQRDEALTMLREGLECGIFDDAPTFKADVIELLGVK